MKPLNLISLILFLGAVIWTLTLSPATVRNVHKTYYKLVSPFLKSGSTAELKAHSFIRETEHSKDLKKQLEVMNNNYGRLQAIEGRFREIERENTDLRAALGFQQKTRFQVVSARIIRRKPSTWWETVVINRGEEKQIKEQDPVLSSEGLVGKTNESSQGISTVILLTDESCQVSAKVAGTPEVGIVSGQRVAYGKEPTLRLRFLSREASLRPGMEIFTTGRGGLFPPDILIGTVISFKSNALDSSAIIKPAVDFNKLSSLFVIVGEEDKHPALEQPDTAHSEE